MSPFQLHFPSLQFVVLGLIASLLWDDTPRIGLDGRMVCEFADFTSDRPRWEGDMLLEGRTIAIFEQAFDGQSSSIQDHDIPGLNKIKVIQVIDREPWKVLELLVDRFPVLNQVVPSAWRIHGGYILRISITPHQWELLQVARKRGRTLEIKLDGDDVVKAWEQ